MSMKCPHCNVVIQEPREPNVLIEDYEDTEVKLHYFRCPSCCIQIILMKDYFKDHDPDGEEIWVDGKIKILLPKSSSRPISPDVPKDLAEDFIEACDVLNISPKASAALSRRCLQNFLRQIIKVNEGKLSVEIKEAITKGKLSSDLAEHLDSIRDIGNFAAHPNKDIQTGQIVPVETNEAEYILDVLEELFDYCIVRPERLRKKKEQWDKKRGKKVD